MGGRRGIQRSAASRLARLSDVVGGLPNDTINLALDARTQTMNLTCARFEANIKGIEADKFTVIPQISYG